MSDAPPPLPDHIGWQLHRANALWQRRFVARMVAAGYPVFADARAALLPLITYDGVPQSGLAAQAGMTKQAIQQHLDHLARDGLIERIANPEDGRGHLVRFTAQGREMLRRSNEVKAEIEAEMAARIGADDWARLRTLIDRLLEDSQGT